MGTDVEAFLCRLAQELRPRANQLADVQVQRRSGELPELPHHRKHEDIAALALEETAAHVTTFLDVLEHRLDVTEVKAPPAALEIARMFARSGIPISELLRAYRLGHVDLLQLIQGEAPRLTGDWELINAATIRLTTMGFEYVDLASEQVVAAYEEERDRREHPSPATR